MVVNRFSYQKDISKINFLYILGAFAFAGCIKYFEWGFAFRRFLVLPYPYTLYVYGGIAILGSLAYLYSLSEDLAINKAKIEIVLKENEIIIPVVKSRKAIPVTVLLKDIKKIYFKQDEEDGDSLIIDVQGDSYELNENGFEDSVKFGEFEKFFKEKLPHLV